MWYDSENKTISIQSVNPKVKDRFDLRSTPLVIIIYFLVCSMIHTLNKLVFVTLKMVCKVVKIIFTNSQYTTPFIPEYLNFH